MGESCLRSLPAPGTVPTMASHVILLRGVNVGGHRKVPAAELRALATDAGFTDAVTLLNSGNLVVGSAQTGSPAASCTTVADVAALVRAQLAERLGFDVDVIVVTSADLDRAITDLPFPEQAASEPSRVLVTFYDRAPDPAKIAAIDLSAIPEQMVWNGATAYTYFPNGAGTSTLTPAILRRVVGIDGTARNWNSVLKLRELARERDE
jgi:uncharacterized protein (DUF1697 family)